METKSTKAASIKVEQAKPITEAKPYTKAMQAKGVKPEAKVAVQTKPVVPAPIPVVKPATSPVATTEAPKPTAQVIEVKPVEKVAQAPLTLESLQKAIILVRQDLTNQALQIQELQIIVARKRKPVANGKMSIRDTKTGKIYPSKNNTYKSLLISGELAELIKDGVFGEDPPHNSFGWYALNRAYPGRFEEIKAGQKS